MQNNATANTSPTVPLGIIKSLTGIRGIMALWVFSLHIKQHSQLHSAFFPDLLPFFSKLFFCGYFGVDVFFMLSGIVMTMVYGAKMKTFNWQQTLYYYRLRWARMVPNHYTMLLVFWVTYKLTEVVFHISANTADKFNLRDLGLNLLLLQSYLPEKITTWNSVSWSISTEFFAYLLFPLVACRILPLPRPILLGLFSVLLLAFIGVFKWVFRGETDFINNVSLLKIGFEFLLGAIATQVWILPVLRKEVSVPSLLTKNLAPLALVGFIAGLFFLPSSVLVVFGLPLLIGLSFQQCWLSKLLSTRFFIFLGEVSFALYLCHHLFITAGGAIGVKVLAKFMALPVAVNVTVVLMLIGSVLASYLLHTFVEKPAYDYVKKMKPKIAP